MRIILYTCLFGGYDRLPNHILVPTIEYIPITSSDLALPPIDLSRYYKILPHKSFPEYDISVYSDSNMELVDPNGLLNLCEQLIKSEATSIFFKHPVRTTCHQEVLECIRQRKNHKGLLDKYVSYRKNGFPDNIPLTENNVIIRKHNDINLIKCEELWWEEFKSGCKRDQVCFPYARWKTNYDNIMLMEYIIKEKIFKWRPHIKNV